MFLFYAAVITVASNTAQPIRIKDYICFRQCIDPLYLSMFLICAFFQITPKCLNHGP